MLPETRTTECEGASELQRSPMVKEVSAYDRELIALIGRTSEGDEAALGTFYDKTGSYVYGLAFRVLNDSTMAEEVTMDVYMQVWKQAAKFDQSRGNPIVWLTVLTRSRAIDRFRVGKKDRETREPLEEISEEQDEEHDPERRSMYSEQGRIVRQAMISLPSEQRVIIELAYFEGLSQSEIATQIGEPLGTVKTRVRLGMVKLRNLLGPLVESLM